MHVKYKFRKPDGLVVPQGPNFASAQTSRSDFDGSVLSFKAPKHRPNRKILKQTIPESHYELNTIRRYFHYFSDKNSKTRNQFMYYNCFRRYWAFYGPWFTGTQAQLQMLIKLLVPVNFDREFSLFHPRAFENLVGEYLFYQYGEAIDPFIQGKSFTVPVNWQPLDHLPLAARFQALPPPHGHIKTPMTHVFFPLNENILVNVEFTPSRLLNLNKEELDKRVSDAPMYKLINNIIDSFQLTLSDNAKQQQKAALEGLDDTSLVQDYPPLDYWSRFTNKANNDQKQIEN